MNPDSSEQNEDGNPNNEVSSLNNGTKYSTVKPLKNFHSKIDKTKILMTNGIDVPQPLINDL